MEIKGIHETYRSMNTAAVNGYARTAQLASDPAQTERSSAQDTVTLSADASFRNLLATESKKYAAPEGASAERIAALREQYQGGCCPVSGAAVASAMLDTVFGRA